MSDLSVIEIVVTAGQYDDLVDDLRDLRAAGAEDNTAAIVAAVHEQANRVRSSQQQTRRAA